MLLFGIGGLFMVTDAAAFAPRWWLALLLVVLSYFSLASGAFAAAAAFAIGAMQFSVRQRSGRRELLALALLAAVTIVKIVYTPALRGHSQLAAHSIGQFLHAMLQILSWPATQNQASLAKVIAGTILVQAPAVLVSAYVIWLRPPLTDRRWLVVTLTGWAVLQAIAVAFGRSVAPMSSRYLDLFAVGVVLNFACLLYLLSASEMARLRRLLALGAALWLLLVLFGATKTLFTRTLPEVAQRQAQGRMQTENMRAYLATGDIRILQNKPFLSIPFPSAEGLAQIASQPLIRALLPPELVNEPSPYRALQRGLARFTGRPIEALKTYALRWGVLFIPAGLTFFLLGLTMQAWRAPEITPSK